MMLLATSRSWSCAINCECSQEVVVCRLGDVIGSCSQRRAGCFPAAFGNAFLSLRGLSFVGTASSSGASEPTGASGRPADRVLRRRRRHLSSGWQKRTRVGATGASRANSRSSASPSRQPASAQCFAAMDSRQPRAETGPPGKSSSPSRRPASWPATSSVWKPCG